MIDIYNPNFKIDELREVNGEELGELIMEYPDIAPMLPKRLEVKGSLNLGNCSSLKSLPEGLEIGGNLYLYGCPAEVPPDAEISGKIYQ